MHFFLYRGQLYSVLCDDWVIWRKLVLLLKFCLILKEKSVFELDFISIWNFRSLKAQINVWLNSHAWRSSLRFKFTCRRLQSWLTCISLNNFVFLISTWLCDKHICSFSFWRIWKHFVSNLFPLRYQFRVFWVQISSLQYLLLLSH